MGIITLDVARHVAKYSTRHWVEVRNDEKTKTLFFRLADDDGVIRRVIVRYDSKVICVVVQGNETGKQMFFYCRDADAGVLKRLTDDPHAYEKLGFRKEMDIEDIACGKEHGEKKKPKKDMDDVKDGKKIKKKVEQDSNDENEESDVKEVKKGKKKVEEDGDDDDLHKWRKELCKLEKKVKEVEAELKKVKELIDGSEKKKKFDPKKKDVVMVTPMLRCYVPEKVLQDIRLVDVGELECFQLTPDGEGVIHSESTGDVYWSTGIWEDAAACLQKSKKKRRPEYLCVGTHGRFFACFGKNDVEYAGPKEFEQLMKLGDVRLVAFGGGADSYVVQYADGGMVWNNIPTALRHTLITRKLGDPRLDYVALGANNEYFLRVGDNVQYGNLTAKAEKAISDCPGTIKEVTFGSGASVVVRYIVEE